MSDTWLKRLAWVLAVGVSVMLGVSAVMLASVPVLASGSWLENQVGSIVTLGAPILGLIIVSKQPRHRIGWLWIVFGLLVSLRTLGHAVYYSSGLQPTGYSGLENFLLWSTEPANFGRFACIILLMLWFPDGKLPSRRWRFLYFWLLGAILLAFVWFFAKGAGWNGGSDPVEGIVIYNPYGWLPINPPAAIAFISFFSIVLIMILAAVSLLFRYRSAGQVERLQLRWFVFGGILLVALEFIPVFFIGGPQKSDLDLILNVIGFAAIVPLYLAVGIAILRYHLYDFDVIVRKTAVYAVLTGLLALLYFGLVIFLQTLVGKAATENSPLIIVISTLAIAALFSPLRRRIQEIIDRRFFRKKYDAQQILAQFALTVRDETDMEKLSGELLQVVQETMQPEGVNMWLKKVER